MKWTVDPGKEYVNSSEKTHQIRHPSLILYDVIDNEIVARLGQNRQTPMKPIENGGPHGQPIDFTSTNARHRQDVGIAKMVKREVPKWFR